jgi:hypothetical protein
MSRAEMVSLVEKAGLVFRGKVARQGTSDARLMKATEGKTTTVEVEEVLRSTEALRGLAGREVILMIEHGGEIEEKKAQLFFTNVLELGAQVLLREVGRHEATREAVRDLNEALKTVEERPLHRRVMEAELILTGRVTSSRRAETPSVMRSEHDPEWWIARVAAQTAVKGTKPKGELEVLFANSTDIAWYKSPKLHEGASGIFILRRVSQKEVPEEARGIYEATDPLDFLPSDRLQEVQRALGHERGERA